MQFYSTKHPQHFTDLKEAIFRGLPPDNGLYMPERIPALPKALIENMRQMSFQEISYEVAGHLLQEDIPPSEIRRIIDKAIDFPAPLAPITERVGALELFHGPSLAFKDFGARFMAETMSYLNRGNNEPLTILVATSGDTGGAVAAGFYQTEGIRVVILYPSGKVSPLQEKQLTTLGHNITAIEVDGTFDDCQALVKQAFLDTDLTRQFRLGSANSINIARLIPQSFYYFEGWKQAVLAGHERIVFSVPSGNFGNLTAGLLAKKMGLPVHHFIAATNQNDVVPQYLRTGEYQPRPSVRTLSNAMDVGSPSNFARMMDLYGSTWNIIKNDISGYAFGDAETEACVRSVYQTYGYLLDPHGAVGYLALTAWQKEHPDTYGMVLETAHPAKFLEDMERILQQKIPVPERLAALANKEKTAVSLGIDYAGFRRFLEDTL